MINRKESPAVHHKINFKILFSKRFIYFWQAQEAQIN